MNIIEAIELAGKERKIRIAAWPIDEYVKFTCGDYGRAADENNDDFLFRECHLISDNWEVFEIKPKLHTFEEAIAAFKRGKTIKRKLWTTKVIERDFCDDYSIEFTIDDFEANDWVIVEG